MVNTRLFKDLSETLTKRRTKQDNTDPKLINAEIAFHKLRRDGDLSGAVGPGLGLYEKTLSQADLINKGRKAIEKGDYRGAIEPLEQAVQLDGLNSATVQAQHALGGAYFGVALGIVPKSKRRESKKKGLLRTMLGWVWPDSSEGRERDINLFLGKAESSLDAAIIRDNSHSEAYFLRGRVAMERCYVTGELPESDNGLDSRISAISDFKKTVDLNHDRELTTEALHQLGQTYEELHGITREAKRLTEETESGEYSVIKVEVGEQTYSFIVPEQFSHFSDVTADVKVQTEDGIAGYLIDVNASKTTVEHEKTDMPLAEESAEGPDRPPTVPRAGTMLGGEEAKPESAAEDDKLVIEEAIIIEPDAASNVSVAYMLSTIKDVVDIYEAAFHHNPEDVYASTRIVALIQDVHTDYENRGLVPKVEMTSTYDGVRKKIIEGIAFFDQNKPKKELEAYQRALGEFDSLCHECPSTDEEKQLYATIKQNIALPAYNSGKSPRQKTLIALQEAREMFPGGPEAYAAIKELHLHNIEENRE